MRRVAEQGKIVAGGWKANHNVPSFAFQSDQRAPQELVLIDVAAHPRDNATGKSATRGDIAGYSPDKCEYSREEDCQKLYIIMVQTLRYSIHHTRGSLSMATNTLSSGRSTFP